MATYEYKCERCSRVFDIIKPMSESDKAEVCPDCNVIAVRKVTKTSFILKGEGFYATDYKDK